MTSSAEVGRQLERRIATFFQSHGYTTRCNEILEGRSGGRHEIDVLAEKSDALTTYRVAVECKARQQPIEKDVVAKLHYVLGDLGLNKGIVVSLAGCRSGADRAAEALGIELWGPDELRRHLGDGGGDGGDLGASALAANTTLSWGYNFRASQEQAENSIRWSGKRLLGLLTLEQLVWLSPTWLPAYSVRLTVAQQEVKWLRPRLRSATLDNLYNALDGTYLGRVPSPWEQVQFDQTTSLPPTVREAEVTANILKAAQGYARVFSPSAVERHASRLDRLGVPTPYSGLNIGQISLVHLPYYVGILHGNGKERVVAVGGRTGNPSDAVSHLLTANLAKLRTLFAR